LKIVAILVLGLGVTAPARIFHAYRVIGEHKRRIVSKFQSFKVSSGEVHSETLKP